MGIGGKSADIFVDNLDNEMMFSKVSRLIHILYEDFKKTSSDKSCFSHKTGRIIVDTDKVHFKNFCKKRLARMRISNLQYLDCADANEQDVDVFFADMPDTCLIILDDYSSLFRLEKGNMLRYVQNAVSASVYRRDVMLLVFVYPGCSSGYSSWNDDKTETTTFGDCADDAEFQDRLGRDFQISVCFD